MNEKAPEPGDPTAGDEQESAPERSSAGASGARTHAKRRGYRGSWLDYVVTMLVALIIAVLVKTFLIQPFFIPSDSMNPTLVQDDKILVSKLTPGVFDLHRGDVVVFEDTQNWMQSETGMTQTPRYRLLTVLSWVGLAPDPSQDHLVKRVIGEPGDRVQCERGGSVSVNGKTIDEPYINPETPACQWDFDVTVPQDKLWVMGDNRFDSADSAYHYSQGEEPFVDQDDVTGRAVAIFWPASHWTGLGDGRDAFDAVPANS
ncbi:signal peptidase I [Brachybacterium endophyticum]|uniref:Signal peptidase I n=1 Tax=Brachybacterium endophyticum TaxID=2182385 RepID=A0A2U2RLL0_9MICO|nr:signal peptidase I [Brachybacterium endophyticum]PWH06721.1 signal peptidase I [Brachybacterium endophyticum]